MKKVRMALIGAAAGTVLLVPTGMALAASDSSSPAPSNGPAAGSPAPGNGSGARGPGPRFEDCPYHEQMEQQFPQLKQWHDQMRQRHQDGSGPGPMMGRGPGSPWSSPSPSTAK